MARLLWFTLKADKPWQDVRVRRAINLALDREQLVSAGMGDKVWGRLWRRHAQWLAALRGRHWGDGGSGHPSPAARATVPAPSGSTP